MLPITFPFVKQVIYDDLRDLWQKRFRKVRDSWQLSPTGQRRLLPGRTQSTLIRVHSCRFVVNELRRASNEGTLRAFRYADRFTTFKIFRWPGAL
jgi:hypothetical protein